MQPWVVAAIAAWGMVARRNGVDIRLENVGTAAYAWRLGLQRYLDVDPGISLKEHEAAGRFIPLRTIRTSQDLGTLLADIVPLLHLAAAPEQAKAVQYVMSEMVRNVLEHARSEDGAVVCAQFYSGESTGRSYVSVGIADTGRGIRSSLATNYPDLADDRQAVLKAIEPGVTGAVLGVYGSATNAGAGLFFTRRLAEATDRNFAVGSGEAMFRTSAARRRPVDSSLVLDINPFPGTVVTVDVGLHEEVDFGDFLALTREAFTRQDERTKRRVQEGVKFV